MTFYTLTVSDVRNETADTVSIAFEVPPALADTFRFVQGQYLTLRATIAAEEVRRSYSLCSSPLEGELRIAIKTVEGGRFSTFANQHLRIGDRLEVMPPMGRFFTALDPAQTRQYVAFAAGSGITPILSILKTTLRTEPNSTFTLFYGNRHSNAIIFKETIEQLKNQYLTRFRLFHILSREAVGSSLFEGRIDGERCQKFARYLFNPVATDAFFLCGPEEMVFSVKEALCSAGVSEQRILFELFGTPIRRPNVAAAPTTPARAADAWATVQTILDGHHTTFRMKTADFLLESALKHGADLPFSCKGGVCSTCRAKVIEGTVQMDINYALEQWEVEAGFVLTCQAHPLSDRVVVNFDEQ